MVSYDFRLFCLHLGGHCKRCVFLLLGVGVLLSFPACTRILTGEQTIYGTKYNEEAFNALRGGMSVEQVTQIIGAPLGVITQAFSDVWSYFPSPSSKPDKHSEGHFEYDLFGPYTHLAFDDKGAVRTVSGDYLKGSFIGKTKQDILGQFGSPGKKQSHPYAIIYRYTLPGKSGTYKVRNVFFDNMGNLINTDARIHVD